MEQRLGLEAEEILILRSVAGVTVLDHRRSEDIGKDLKMFKFTDTLYLNTKQWQQRLERIDDNCVSNKMYN
jgi:hypothetical protein